jgi:hypothetical protein
MPHLFKPTPVGTPLLATDITIGTVGQVGQGLRLSSSSLSMVCLKEARVELGRAFFFIISGDLCSFQAVSACHGVLFLRLVVKLCKVWSIPALNSPTNGFFFGT